LSLARLPVIATAALLGSAALTSASTCPATPAPGTVCYDIVATVTSDNSGTYLGQTGTGTLSYEVGPVDAAGGNTTLFSTSASFPSLSPGLFDFHLDIFGQTFSDPADTDSSLTIVDYDPSDWSLLISRTLGSSPFAISDPNIVSFGSIGSLALSGNNALAIDLTVDDTATGAPAPVPLPAGFWMLGAGVLGAGLWARRRKPTS
jgi:hypothetical protein